MRTKSRVLVLFYLFIPLLSVAQEITLDLPACRYWQYIFCLNYGTGQDTVKTGRFDEKGHARFSLPERYSSYRGVGVLTIPTTPKRLGIVINGEPVLINEPAGSTDMDNKLMAISSENTYLTSTLSEQASLLQAYYYAMSGLSIRQKGDSLYDRALADTEILSGRYVSFRDSIRRSDYYSARILELLNCLSGVGSAVNISPDSVLNEQHRFLVDELDFRTLYTSGYWSLACDTWFQTCRNDDSLLLSSSRRMLDRCKEDLPVQRELIQSLISIFSKYGKDNLLLDLGREYLTIPLNGMPAPALQLNDKVSIIPKNSLLLFYETGCGNCHKELHDLKEKYWMLESNDIRVVSISADMEREVFESSSTGFPWKDWVYDQRGFNSENFRNYGIVGTPTFILVDKEGIIRGRFAKISELLK
ncbi:peroxiredoxin family protein [Dysgonomonas macrotermitis]|uniref:Thioredoxin-like n=1 Tax=Dysgonomonas macrotermitis TaxID=1346286 RepID=A0A1M5JZL4_9BACT|nr:thioredoxin family protein [Dysgonomonas macrotermitis]SHG46022.1 Thioredoxin-like [Dysgonomonas macrotermitis]